MLLKERVMTTFDVKDMTCAHCTNAITQAVLAVDPSSNLGRGSILGDKTRTIRL